VTHVARLVYREIMAGEIMMLRFEKPGAFQFLAGQFCAMTVPDLGFHDERGLRRPFSIASSPLESELIFAARAGVSAFKRTLREMPIRSPVTIGGPFGKFVLPEETSPFIIFLAGGLGITPFRSMAHYICEAGTGHNVTLFYSSRVPEEAVFLDELQGLAESHTNVRLVATMTRPELSSGKWTGLTGRISPMMIKEGRAEWTSAIYYIVGPPAMVDETRRMLIGMNIPPDRIKLERWAKS
jgi:ferredoxin-NADP reductase